MLKELKYLTFILIISLFLFFTIKYYFSDDNKKNSYRSFKNNNEKVYDYSQKLTLLNNNTEDIIEYVKKTENKDKKNYNFWKLISNNE